MNHPADPSIAALIDAIVREKGDHPSAILSLSIQIPLLSPLLDLLVKYVHEAREHEVELEAVNKEADEDKQYAIDALQDEINELEDRTEKLETEIETLREQVAVLEA